VATITSSPSSRRTRFGRPVTVEISCPASERRMERAFASACTPASLPHAYDNSSPEASCRPARQYGLLLQHGLVPYALETFRPPPEEPGLPVDTYVSQGTLPGHIGGTSLCGLSGNLENYLDRSRRSDGMSTTFANVTDVLAQDPAYRPARQPSAANRPPQAGDAPTL